MTIRTAALLLASSMILSGCGFMSRTKSSFYTIEPVPGTVTAIQGIPFAVDIVELPPGFDRKEIVVRQADGQLEIRETQQWTALLEPSVLHAVAFNLASRLPEGMMILPGQAVPAGGTRAIDLMFEEIVAGPENELVIDVRWTVRGGATHHERIVTRISSLDSGEIATGMSRGLATLSERILERLR